MKYLHSMVRVRDLEAALRFYCDGLGLRESRRREVPEGKYTLVFLCAPDNPEAEVELTFNWDAREDYGSARNFLVIWRFASTTSTPPARGSRPWAMSFTGRRAMVTWPLCARRI